MGSHESLRNALAWLLTQRKVSTELIEQVSRRYDLSPLDEAFCVSILVKLPLIS